MVQALPASASRLSVNMTVNGAVATGTWTEETEPGGYYSGPSTMARSSSWWTRPGTGWKASGSGSGGT